jgi:HD superfamily phosphodiesterase
MNNKGKLKPIYLKIFEKAKPFLRTRKNLVHTRISLRYALRLLREEEGDESVVIPAILLHDVGWKTIPEHLQLTAFGPDPSNPQLTKAHEVNGAKIAKAILEEFRYPPEKITQISRIIRGHDTRKRALSRSDRIVKDADKLFRYSQKGTAIDLERFGVARKDYLSFLEVQVEKWFFLATSRQLAREELFRKKKGTTPQTLFP